MNKMRPSLTMDIFPVEGRTATILAAGDFTLPPEFEAASAEQVFHPDLLGLLHAKDLSIMDLEFPLATSDRPISKSGPHLSGSPATVRALAAAKVDVVTMANNHALDYGPEAMFATQTLCERGGVRTVGIGRNTEQASRPLVTEAGGIKIAIVALAEEEFCCADASHPGAAKLDLPAAARSIREARASADVVLVCVHGGNEYYPLPSPRMRRWYRFLVDCGAHAVLGDHPHTVQGTEVYAGAPIVYSLGNLVLAYAFGSRPPYCWNQGIIVRLTVGVRGAQRIEFFATRQTLDAAQARVEPLAGEEERMFAERLQKLSVIAADEGRVEAFWKCFCWDRGGSYFAQLKGGSAVTRSSALNMVKAGVKGMAPHYLGLGLTQFLGRYATRPSVREAEWAGLCNLIRCPAHHEVLVTAVEMARNGVRPAPDVWEEYTALMKDCRS